MINYKSLNHSSVSRTGSGSLNIYGNLARCYMELSWNLWALSRYNMGSFEDIKGRNVESVIGSFKRRNVFVHDMMPNF